MNKKLIAIIISIITLTFTLASFSASNTAASAPNQKAFAGAWEKVPFKDAEVKPIAKGSFTSAAATFLNAGNAYPACPRDAVQECFVNGKRGTRTCDGLRWSRCIVVEETPQSTATLKLNYVVVTVVYSPPGNASNASSSVSYADGSSAGSTVGCSSSFQSGVTISAESITGTIGGNFGFKRNSTSSNLTDISKSSSYTIEHSGPKSTNGLNNDMDAVYLALRPTVNLRALPIRYSLKMDGAVLQYVHVGWLKNPATMPGNIKATLSGAGVTPADYPKILKASIYHEGGLVSAANSRLIP